jgi:hypothetical protein
VAFGLRRASRHGELGVTLIDSSSRKPAPATPEARSPSAAR